MAANRKTPTKRWRWLGLVLFLLFALAMFMGPGPGLRLVNPEPNAWGLFWYCIQAAVVVTASLTLWKTDDE